MNRFSNSKQMNKQIKTLKSRNVSLSKDLMEANASREELAEANRKLEKENRMYSKPHSHTRTRAAEAYTHTQLCSLAIMEYGCAAFAQNTTMMRHEQETMKPT